MSQLLRAAFLVCALGVSSAHAAILVTVDKSAQQMTVAVDGKPLYQWPVSTGKAGYDTPSGKFRAFRMERDHFSKEFDDAPMPFSIFFTEKGHAIHGSYDKRIGQAVSHGCVRLSPANAETLYALVEREGVLNTTVVLTGTIPSAAPAVARRRVVPQQDALDYDARPQYAEPRYADPQYAQPQYAQPQYAQPQYAQPQYVQPRYAEPQYAQPQPQYVQPQYRQRYVAPPGYYYAQPYPSYAQPRGYVYRDPYGAPVYQNRGSFLDD